MSQVRRQPVIWMLLPCIALLLGCPDPDRAGSSRMKPSSREELDFGSSAPRDTTALADRDLHQDQVAIGPDSAPVRFEWGTGSRNGRRIPYRASVIIPEHPESDEFTPRFVGILPGQRDSIFAANVALTHTRTVGSRATTNVVQVELGGDGSLRVSNP